MSIATPVHEDCKSKSKELKEDGVIGQEKRHELTELEYTKETEENLQPEESADHVRTVRLDHETHKECGEGLKNEEGKELLVTATLFHENDKSKIKELVEDGVIREANQHKLAEQEYNMELDGSKQNEENTEHFTTVPLDHNDENYTLREGYSSTEREESYNESASHYKHKQSKRMRFNENPHLAEQTTSRNLCNNVNYSNSKGARNKNVENSYRLDHRRLTDTSSEVNLRHGIPNKSISSQNNTGQSSLPKRADIQPKTKPAVLVKRICRAIKQVPQESTQKERERLISNYVSNICASIAVECSHLLFLPLPPKASDISNVADCQEFGAKQLYGKDEETQPCSPVPTESSLETLTNEVWLSKWCKIQHFKILFIFNIYSFIFNICICIQH